MIHSGPNGERRRGVLLKLSGETFGGGTVGLGANVLIRAAAEIAEAIRDGIWMAIVVGGDSFFRDAELQTRGMDRACTDYMGILGTVMNAIALQDSIERAGIPCRVQTAITVTQVAGPYIPLQVVRHLEKGKVVVSGAGAGTSYSLTDTVATQRVAKLRCGEILIGKSDVSGIYTAGPKVNPGAVKLNFTTYEQAISQGLRAVDTATFPLCQDNDVAMRMFEMGESANVTRALRDEKVDTLVLASRQRLTDFQAGKDNRG